MAGLHFGLHGHIVLSLVGLDIKYGPEPVRTHLLCTGEGGASVPLKNIATVTLGDCVQ